jgi:hypothetical protein
LAISSFHFSTLEEYYTGGLFLGPGNGISDGSAVIISGFFLMGIFGNNVFQDNCMEGVRYADIIMFAVALTNIVVILLCVKGIVVH